MALLDDGTLAVLLTGNTLYVALDGGGEAVVHYGADRSSHMRLPGGKRMTGRWRLRDDGYHVCWQDGPEGDWHIDHQPGRFAYLDGTRETRGVVSRIVPGDSEAFVG